MAENKSERFIRRMCEKTEAGEVAWERTAVSDKFQTSVTGFLILFGSDKGAFGRVFEMRILNTDGDIVDTNNDEMFDPPGTAEQADSIFRLMKKSFGIARRQAMGIDQALEDILKELDGGEGDDN